jgi:hypothetical protein
VHCLAAVTFLELRKRAGTASIDRRTSYIDVIERVLGNQVPLSGLTGSRRFFSTKFSGLSNIGSTISEVQVSILDSIEDTRKH